jgi:SAM-dependent methyltransferase
VPLDPPPPWDYAARASDLLRGAATVVDLGTGGGEVFAALLTGYRGRAVATEPWGPNAPVAARRLKPLGAHVVNASSLRLPVPSGRFDLVLDRHEELDPTEVARVLAPGGTVLTQQVHPDYHAELRRYFPRMTDFGRHEVSYREGLAAQGLRVVDAREHHGRVAYRHLGELVYLLVAAPWTVPNFDVEADLEALLAAERELRGPEGIVLSDGLYILEACRPQ